MSHSQVKNIFNHKSYPFYTKESSLFLLNRNVGIELEYENVSKWPNDIKDDGEFWEITEDGSLRRIKDGTVSLEIRFKYPLSGLALEKALVYLRKYLSTERDIVCSLRTGLHVHLDVRDLSITQIKNIFITYLIVEKLLYRYCGDDRENNIFCLPLYKTPEVIQRFSLDSFQDINTFKNSVDRGWKYSGLNLVPIWKKGSIEFRQHSATTNVEEIIYWINIIFSIAKYGINLNYKVNKLIEHASINDSIVEDIFGNYLRELDISNLRADLDVGIESVLCLQTNFMSTIYGNYLSKDEVKPNKISDDYIERPNTRASVSARFIVNDDTISINDIESITTGYSNRFTIEPISSSTTGNITDAERVRRDIEDTIIGESIIQTRRPGTSGHGEW